MCLISISSSAASKECRNRLSDYVGDVSVTNGGRTCQKWISQLPHSHTTANHDMPLNSTLEDVNNYCRSAGGDYVPWCFTKDPRLRWEYCDRRICGGRRPLMVMGKAPSGEPLYPWTGLVRFFTVFDSTVKIVTKPVHG